jgi:hypothetical protein
MIRNDARFLWNGATFMRNAAPFLWRHESFLWDSATSLREGETLLWKRASLVRERASFLGEHDRVLRQRSPFARNSGTFLLAGAGSRTTASSSSCPGEAPYRRTGSQNRRLLAMSAMPEEPTPICAAVAGVITSKGHTNATVSCPGDMAVCWDRSTE